MKGRRHTPEQIVRKLLLRREGWILNRKKVLRIWREEGLKVQARHHKRRRPPRARLVRRAEHPNHAWAIDFQFDATSDGHMLSVAWSHLSTATASPGPMTTRHS